MPLIVLTVRLPSACHHAYRTAPLTKMRPDLAVGKVRLLPHPMWYERERVAGSGFTCVMLMRHHRRKER